MKPRILCCCQPVAPTISSIDAPFALRKSMVIRSDFVVAGGTSRAGLGLRTAPAFALLSACRCEVFAMIVSLLLLCKTRHWVLALRQAQRSGGDEGWSGAIKTWFLKVNGGSLKQMPLTRSCTKQCSVLKRSPVFCSPGNVTYGVATSCDDTTASLFMLVTLCSISLGSRVQRGGGLLMVSPVHAAGFVYTPSGVTR